jgi:AcrR family transcriptional regulator
MGTGTFPLTVSPAPQDPNQLPSGRHGLTRDEVVSHQRARVVEAVADVVSVAGYAATTVEDIIVTARVSRRTFYDLHSNKQDAFLMAYDAISARLLTALGEVLEQEPAFTDRIRDLIATFLQFFHDHPPYADVLLMEVMAAGPEAVERRNWTLDALAALVLRAVDEGQPKRGRPPELVAEGIVGGMYEIVYARVLQGRTARLLDLLPDLTFSALLPYVGQDAAVAEQRRLRRRVKR